jgi:FKBP-type peptidyl-prolyl cis-trans isomerase
MTGFMRTSIRPFAALTVVAALWSAPVAAQVSELTPPPDLAAPPADAMKSPTGLISKVSSRGTCDEKPTATDIVTVNYTGWTSEGRMFDSTVARGNPSTFPLGRVMAGWKECVQLMVIGERRRCWVPQDLAYKGQAGKPTGTVVFDIELLETRSSPTIPPPDVKEPPKDASRTASGLAYKVLRKGTGFRHPDGLREVLVHYTGWTTDGKMFDSSIPRGAPTPMRLDDVIKGWSEGVQLMVEGERTRFWIPQDLAYKGQSGSPRGMLVFDIELVKIN